EAGAVRRHLDVSRRYLAHAFHREAADQGRLQRGTRGVVAVEFLLQPLQHARDLHVVEVDRREPDERKSEQPDEHGQDQKADRGHAGLRALPRVLNLAPFPLPDHGLSPVFRRHSTAAGRRRSVTGATLCHSIFAPIRLQSGHSRPSMCIQIRTALPTRFSSGTVPMTRLSWLLSRLSPIMKYSPSGTFHSPSSETLSDSSMRCSRSPRRSMYAACSHSGSVPARRFSTRSPFTNNTSSRYAMVSPGSPTTRLM